MSTNDFEECWGKGVSQDDDMSMFIDSEDESKGNTEEEQEVEIDCLSDGDELEVESNYWGDDDDEGMFFKPEKIEVTNGLDDDGWLYQDDGWLYQDDKTEETVERCTDGKVSDDDDFPACLRTVEIADDIDEEVSDDWEDEEMSDDIDEEQEKCDKADADAGGNDMSEVLSKLFADDTGNTCYKSKNRKKVSQESAIETYMNLVRKNLSKEEAVNILYGEGSITDCLVRLFGEAVLREVVSD